MMEVYRAIYVVRPLPQLIELVNAIGADWGTLVTEPQLFSRLEGHSDQAWSIAFPLRDAQVKTLFLIWLRHEFFRDGTNDLGIFLAKLLSFPQIDISVFSTWWYLERFECISDEFERFCAKLDKGLMGSVSSQPAIEGYDEWIATIK